MPCILKRQQRGNKTLRKCSQKFLGSHRLHLNYHAHCVVCRVLKNGGLYLCISLLEEHIQHKLLHTFASSKGGYSAR